MEGKLVTVDIDLAPVPIATLQLSLLEFMFLIKGLGAFDILPVLRKTVGYSDRLIENLLNLLANQVFGAGHGEAVSLAEQAA